MTTTRKLAAIFLAALLGLAIYWGVTHLAKLIVIAAIVASVAVVAGPAIAKVTRKARSTIEPKAAPNPVSAITDHAGNVDWDAVVRGYKLPSERDHA